MNLFQSIYKAADIHGRTVLSFQAKHPAVDAFEAVAVQEALPRRSWLDRLDDWFWQQDAKRREEYLARSENLFDLEQRMRDLERNGTRSLFG